MKTKTLKAIETSWSYVVNENDNAIRATLIGYGSSTPIDILQKWIDNLSKKEFEKIWEECEIRKDKKD